MVALESEGLHLMSGLLLMCGEDLVKALFFGSWFVICTRTGLNPALIFPLSVPFPEKQFPL